MSELRVIRTIKRSFSFVKNDPTIVVLFVLPALFPVERIVGNYLTSCVLLVMLGPSELASTPSSMPPLPILLPYLIVGFLLGVWAAAGAILKVTGLEKESKLGLKEALSEGLKKVPKLLIPAITGMALYILMIASMMMAISCYRAVTTGAPVQSSGLSISSMVVVIVVVSLLLIAGLFVAVRLRLAAPACVTENNFGLKTSWRLVKGNWWKVFAIFLVFGVASAVISQIPIVGIYLRGLIVEPLGITAATVIYLQLRAAGPSEVEHKESL